MKDMIQISKIDDQLSDKNFFIISSHIALKQYNIRKFNKIYFFNQPSIPKVLVN